MTVVAQVMFNGVHSSTSPLNLCLNNLRMIDGAKDQFVIEHHLTNGVAVKQQDISPYLPDGKLPVCVKGGQYTINVSGSNAVCSIHGTSL
jgi:hypothetical protein